MKNKIVWLITLAFLIGLLALPMASAKVSMYNSLTDEAESDGVTDVNLGVLGDTNGNETIDSNFLILTPAKTGWIDTITITINEITGTPQSNNFVYDVSICETAVANLSANATYGADCSNTPTTLINDFDSTILNTTGSYNLSLDSNFNIDTTKDYILMFDYVSGTYNDGVTDAWKFGLDDNPTSDFWLRVIGSTPTTYSNIAEYELLGCEDKDGDGYSVSGGDCGTVDVNDNDSEIITQTEQDVEDSKGEIIRGYEVVITFIGLMGIVAMMGLVVALLTGIVDFGQFTQLVMALMTIAILLVVGIYVISNWVI